jgi:hypothetical protein
MKSTVPTVLRWILVAAFAVLATVLVPASPTEVSASRAEPGALELVHQDLALPPGTPLRIQFHPPTPIDATTSTITVRAYPPITLREDLKKAIDHDLSGFVSQAAVAPDPAMVDAAGNVTINVNTDGSPGALRLDVAGLYPVLVRVITGGEQADLVTFVYRLPDLTAPPLGQISIAVLASITAPPSISSDPAPLPADVTNELAELSNYRGVKLSVAISPDILGRLDETGLDGLRAVMVDGLMMSQPAEPFDPSSVTPSDLGEQFRTLLTKGEDIVNRIGGLPLADRTVWYAPESISTDGALVLRDAGVKMLLTPSEVYLKSKGNLGDITDYSQLFETVLPGPGATADDADQTCEALSMTCMPTAVVDPLLAARFTDRSLSDEQAALYTAADVVAYREQFSDSLSAGNGHALVLGPEGEGVANAERISRAVEMLTGTVAAKFITLDHLEESSGAFINDGRQIELRLPEPKTIVDLHDRKTELGNVTFAATFVGSMLVTDGGRLAGWRDTISSLYSTALSDDQVSDAIDGINRELDEIKACVHPPTAYPVTLTGQSAILPLRFTNTCEESLDVIVHLAAATDKLKFENDILLRLAHGTTPFNPKVTARANGTFPVTLDVWTPTGKVSVTDQVTLQMSVRALTGLPQLLTGAGLLILLTWWVRNQRRGRRLRRNVASRTEHPATRPEPT